VVNELNDQQFTFVEVTPGGPDDPFTAHNQTSLPAAAASPVQLAGGAVMATPAEGYTAPVTQVVPSASVQHVTPAQVAPAVAPATPATPAAPLDSLQQAIADGKLAEYIAGQIKEQTGKVVSGLQSSYDKRVAALERERDEAREAIKNAQREAKLTSEDLTDDEKDILREKWKLEDERALLDQEVAQADLYYKSLYVAGLAQEYAQFGVTAEALEQFSEPEEMDNFVRDQELAFYKSGRVVTAVVPSGTAVAAGATASNVPAGATAASDVGGGAPASAPKQPNSGTGIDAMKENLANLKWETVQWQ